MAVCAVTLAGLLQSSKAACQTSTEKQTELKNIVHTLCVMYVLISTWAQDFMWVPMLFRYPARAPADHYQREPFRTKPGDDPASSLSPGDVQHADPAARGTHLDLAAELRHAGPCTDSTAAHRWVTASNPLGTLWACRLALCLRPPP